jgi:hypothetical protein
MAANGKAHPSTVAVADEDWNEERLEAGYKHLKLLHIQVRT